MGFLNKLMNKSVNNIQNDITFDLSSTDGLSFLKSDTGNYEIVSHICMDYLSKTVSKLDIKQYKITEQKGRELMYDEDLDYLLNVSPNSLYNASTMKYCVEYNRNKYGNAYIYIHRKKSKVLGLYLLPSERIQIVLDNEGIYGNINKNDLHYIYNEPETGKMYNIKNYEMIHLKANSFNGIFGVPIANIISNQLSMNKNSEDFLNRMYQNNMFGGKIFLESDKNLDDKAKKKLTAQLEGFSINQSGKFIPLPTGMRTNPVEMKLTDAEFSVLRKANNLQIASAFGLPPNVINDYEKSSYSNSITQNQFIYTNTIQPILKQWDEELSRKLLLGVNKKQKRLSFNAHSLFTLNPIEAMEYTRTGVNNLIMTTNEARELLNLPWYDNEKANTLIGNGNLIGIDDIGKQYNENKGSLEE